MLLFVSDFSTTVDPISSTPSTLFSTSNKCICGNDILSNSTLIKELMGDLSELQQQVSSLDLSMRTLNHSKTAISAFDDLDQTVTGVMANMEELNDSVTQLLSESVALKGSNSNLNDTIFILNNSVTTVISDTADLKASVSELNDSQLVSSSMIPDWPDAIACNLIYNDRALGMGIHYLASVAEPSSGGDYYTYNWDLDYYVGSGSGTSSIIFRSDGSWHDQEERNAEVTDCWGKSIQQLSDAGLAFNFLVTTKL